MTAEEHNRFVNLSIIAVAIALIIGILYWWTTTSDTIVPSTANQTDLRAQVAAILRTAPVQVTQQEIDHVASQLSASKTSVSDAQKQAVVDQLNGK